MILKLLLYCSIRFGAVVQVISKCFGVEMAPNWCFYLVPFWDVFPSVLKDVKNLARNNLKRHQFDVFFFR